MFLGGTKRDQWHEMVQTDYSLVQKLKDRL